jgi:hypothetical protein
MIKENKNKFRLNAKSKILVLGLILIAIVGIGLFSPAGKANAVDCTNPPANNIPTGCTPVASTNGTGGAILGGIVGGLINGPTGIVAGATAGATVQTAAANLTPKSDFQKYVSDYGCGIFGDNSLLPGCLISGSYYLFYAIPSGILWLAASFFDVLISVTLGSKLFNASFVASAWAVVRDLSNIFFILILLYIAIKLILGLGGSDVKKMIAKVIIIALLINFSMFFTEVIIDSSNILALIFYNKLDVCDKDPATGKCRPYPTITGEIDVAGSMMNSFDPTKLLTGDFFKTAGTIDVQGVGPTSAPVSYQMIILVTILAGLVMLFAAYAFFVAGISFMGRMIELFVLIVFSPFAFMSSTIPLLSGVEYIGWDAWFKKLLKVAFMAPIFMFFMYFIFMLINVKPSIFNSLVTQTGDSMLLRILSVIIPAGLILILLMKATEFAKKGSGVIGEKLMQGAKMVGGLALGAATGGAAMLGTRVIGGAGGALANKGAEFAEKHGFGRVGGKLRDVGDFARKSSFDVRGVKIGGKTLASATGMKLGEAQKGGWTEMKKQQEEKRQKRADELEKRGTKKEKMDVDNAEIAIKEKVIQTRVDMVDEHGQPITDAQGHTIQVPLKLALENFDKQMDKVRKEMSDAKLAGDDQLAHGLNDELTAIKNRKQTERNNAGLPELERARDIAKVNLDAKSDKITTAYAETISGGLSKSLNMIVRAGAYSLAGADEAARKIRTGTKLDSGEKPH